VIFRHSPIASTAVGRRLLVRPLIDDNKSRTWVSSPFRRRWDATNWSVQGNQTAAHRTRARYLPATSGVGSYRMMSTELDRVHLHTRPLAYVLDDDREITDLVSGMLATCGFNSRELADPSACVRTIRDAHPEARPNVVVLDLSLR
jgi:hypothetical protein